MKVREVFVKLKSASPYSQSKPVNIPKKNKELAADYEARTWRERMHVNKDGNVFIPPMSLKNALAEAAKFLSQQIPGKGKQTWTKHFEAGVLVQDPVVLPYKKDEVAGEDVFVPSDGKRGGGSRVWKTFPVIPEWEGEARFIIIDETITQKAFEEHLEQCGNLIGIGRFRPRNCGIYGRFTVESVEWPEDD